jgi:hypothetical protein
MVRGSESQVIEELMRKLGLFGLEKKRFSGTY